MKLSIFYHHLCAWAQQKDQSINSVLDTARSLGITHIEVDRDDIKDPQQFAALLAAHDLQVSSIYGFYDWVNHPDDFKDDLQLRQAVLLHCDKIMIIPGFYSAAACHDNADHSSANSKALQKVREKLRNKLRSTGKSDDGSDLRAHEDHLMQGSMRQMIERAAALGLTVTIEDFDLNISPICSSRGMLAMQQNAPSLRTTFDTGNFYYSGEDALDAMNALRGTISHVHLKDRLLLPSLPEEQQLKNPEKVYGTPKCATSGENMYPCAVGAGSMPIREILEDLHGQGYTGCCAMEFFDVADYEKATRDSVDFLRQTGFFDHD